MVNVYLSGADARNAAADLWQSDQLKRLNDQFAPPPADTAQPLPSAPVEAAGDQGSSLPSPPAVGPAMTQPAPPAAVPAPVAAPNPTPDRNDIADHFTRNAVADAWEQNALADVTKGVSQAGAGVQSALADVPKEAQGLVSNYAVLPGAQPTPPAQSAPGAISGIPAPQPTQGQVATVAGGGGTDVEQYIRQSAAAHGIEPDTAVRVAQSEGGLTNPVRQSDYVDPSTGQREQSFGPFQLYLGGGLGNAALKAGIDPRDPNQWRQAVDFALDQAAKGGWSPWHGAARAGIGNFEGIGQAASSVGQAIASAGQTAGTDQTAASVGGPTRLDRTSQFQLGLSDADAYAACGPAAAIAFARAFGRNPTSQEALQLAKQSGWTQGGGMNGVVNEKKLMDAMGVPTTLETTVNWSKITSDAQNGNPVIVSTPGHYFTVDDAKQAQDGSTLYHVGTSGTDLRGGSEWMSAGEIQRRMGTANGALFADHPQASGPSLTEQAAGVVRSVAAPVQQKAQDLLSTVGNIGSAIGTAAGNVGGALNSPNLPSQIYQNSPIGAFNAGLQGVGGAIQGGVSSLGQSGVAQAAGQIGSVLGLQNPLDAAQTYTQIQQKYGGGLQPTPSGGMTWRPPDYSQMTPEDQAAMTNATMAIGGVIGEPGAQMPKPGGAAARGLPPNEPLATGAQPGQLGFGTELPVGGPRPAGVEAVGPAGPQPGQLQIGSELPIGGPRPTGTEPLAPGAQPGQMQFGSELPMGGPPPTGAEALGPAGAQRGQMQIGSELPVGGPRPTGTEPLAPGAQPGQFQLGSELPLGGPAPTGTEAQGAIGALPGQQPLPGVKPTFQLTKGNPVFQALGEGKQTIFSLTNFHTLTIGEGTFFGPGGPQAAWDFLRAYNPFGGQGYVQGRMEGDLGYWFRRAQANGVTLLEGATNPEVGAVSGLSPAAQIGARAAGGAVTGFATGYKSTQVAGGTDEEALRNGLISGAVGAVLGPTVAQSLHQALWGRAVPLAKVLTFKAAVEGGAPAAEASKFANNLAGGQNLRNIADSPWIANALRLVATAPDWLISQFRLAGAGLAGTAKSVPGVSNIPGVGAMTANEQLSRDFLLKAVGTGLFATELLQKGLTGHFTNENEPGHQFQVELPTGKLDGRGLPENTTISLFPGNVQGLLDLAARRDPGAFIHGRVSPALGLTADLLKNTDYRGKPIVEPGTSAIQAFPQEAAYVASRYAPIGIAAPEQQIQQGAPPGLVAASALTGLKIGHDTASAALFAQRDQIVAQGWPSMADQIKKSDAYRNSPPARQSQMLADAHRSLTNQAMVLTDPQGIGAYMTPAPQGQVNPALGLLASAGVPVPASPPQTINYNGRQVQLSPQEQQMRQQTLAQRLEQSMAGYIKSEKFQALPPEQQYKALEPVVKSATQYADQRVIAAMTPEDRKARLAMAPLAHSAAAVPYVGSGDRGLAAIVAQQSGADAAAAHQRLLDQYSSIAPQLTPTAAPAR